MTSNPLGTSTDSLTQQPTKTPSAVPPGSTARASLLAGVPVVIVEDDRATAKIFTKWLDSEAAATIWCSSLGDFRDRIEGPGGWMHDPRQAPRILITDLVLPDGDGLEALSLWRKHFPQNPVIVVTAFASVENAVDTMRKGAFDFLRKPIERDEMLIVLNRAMEHVRLLLENESLSAAVRVLSMAQTLAGLHEKEQLLKTLGRLLHREFDANECFVYLYNASRKHLECCLDFRNPGVPRRAPDSVAQQELWPLVADRSPPSVSFGPPDIKDVPAPRALVNEVTSRQIIELTSTTGNCAYLVLSVPNLDQASARVTQYFPVMVQAQRTFQNLDLAAELSFVDELTGLYNQRFLDVALANEIARSHRYQTPTTVIFIDLDSFKKVNDTYGHLVGSAILRAASKLLRSCMRDADQILRYGGDEFVALLPSTAHAGAQIVAERVRSSFENAVFDVSMETGITEATDIRITTSIGVACYPEAALDARDLLQRADNAMYESKRSGKNRVTFAQAHAGEPSTSHRDGLLRKANASP